MPSKRIPKKNLACATKETKEGKQYTTCYEKKVTPARTFRVKKKVPVPEKKTSVKKPAAKKKAAKKPAAAKPAAKKKPIKHPYAMGDPKGFASVFGVNQQKGTEGLLSMLGSVEPSLVNKIMGGVEYPLEPTQENVKKLEKKRKIMWEQLKKKERELMAVFKKKYPTRKELVAFVKTKKWGLWIERENMKMIYFKLAEDVVMDSKLSKEYYKLTHKEDNLKEALREEGYKKKEEEKRKREEFLNALIN